MAVAKAGETALAAVASRPRRVKVRGGYGAAQRPVITTMTVAVGLGLLDRYLTGRDREDLRPFLIKMGVLGFGLALMAETTPKLGRSFAYLILTAVVFDRTQSILRELNKPKRAPVEKEQGNPLVTPPQPVTLYVRQGPMTSAPPVPERLRIKRPTHNAALVQV